MFWQSLYPTHFQLRFYTEAPVKLTKIRHTLDKNPWDTNGHASWRPRSLHRGYFQRCGRRYKFSSPKLRKTRVLKIQTGGLFRNHTLPKRSSLLRHTPVWRHGDAAVGASGESRMEEEGRQHQTIKTDSFNGRLVGTLYYMESRSAPKKCLKVFKF